MSSSSDYDAGSSHSGALRFDDFATRVVYIVTLALGCISSAQIDLWWLLRAGQDIWHTRRVSLAEHYSHTAAGDYWSNHEWLWEVTAFGLHRVGGMALLTAWVGATIVATIWVLRQCSAATGYVVPIVLFFAIPVMSVSWTTRPQVTSMLLFAITMLLLAREKYWGIPPLFLLWANIHAQVVMGGLLLGSTLVLSLVDHVRVKSPETARRTSRLVQVTAVSALATLATPLGPRLWSYVLSANGRPGQDQIAEWQTVFHPFVSNVMFGILALVALVAAVLRRDRLHCWNDRIPLVATAAMAPLAVLAVRNIPFFLVAVMPLLMTLLAFRTKRAPGVVRHAHAALGAITALAVACVAAVWVAQPPKLDWHPVGAPLARALRDCPGPLYNDYNEGAALIWWVPDVKVFVDNRQDPYPADVIDASADLDARTYGQVFARYDIGCAYVPAGSNLLKALRHDGWRTTYEDASSVVLVPGPVAPRATTATE